MKRLVLRLCKFLGLFAVAARLTATRPRILCYHGIALEDEHEFRPGLFMRAGTFARRMALVRQWGFEPVSLDEMYRQGKTGKYQPYTLTITIDDGWAGIEQGMMPALREHSFPATLYLSTYFVEARRPVFKVAASYLFWKHGRDFVIPADSCIRPYSQRSSLDEDQLLALAKTMGSEFEQPILEELGRYFGESIADWEATGKFMFLSSTSVQKLAQQGLAIELHTHKHRFSEVGVDEARGEIDRNRESIHRIVGVRPQHFCYPRGEYSNEQLEVLQDLGIHTATTTRNELVARDDALYELPRIMDGEGTSDLEFEAELSGFMSLLRTGRACLPGGR
ncbi:polysaccharide deacetylase family protein [Kineobactrum salinum]|uniref:Polysaccharide deacetylase family protein n=1 Tax=Kineobactrum salinum TaxID=2708301 RepID=A0A6C0U2X2_9GAMM|nr:polysaccharide deacetylase family protein [Kineobactrum salinum]QIB64715.1 polysaccharide deacetylase family protein [Kineobactrum salinum]